MKNYSGIAVDNSVYDLGVSVAGSYRQKITLPSDYVRGSYYPEFTGAQFLVQTDSDDVSFEWELRDPDGALLDSGEVAEVTETGGKGWVDIEFKAITVGKTEGEWEIRFTSDKPIYQNSSSDKGRAEVRTSEDPLTYIPIVLTELPEISFAFRALANIADSGTDYLGNSFRSVVVERPTTNLTMVERSDRYKSWMSKPNPSKFAVESLYFDVRDSLDNPGVVNRVLIDSITPGVFFHVYYSDLGNPGTDNESWDDRVWQRIPRTFRLDQRKTFALPEPITANYIKVEFTHLQARHYDPGEYQTPVTYYKHPKWVLDHFYSIYLGWNASNEILAPSQTLRYDAFDLYYSYFKDDILESPDFPTVGDVSIDSEAWNGFLSMTTEEELDNLDSSTISQIRTNVDRFTQHPLVNGALGSTLRDYSLPRDIYTTYSGEQMSELISNTDLVSTEDREAVLLDRQFPVMSFHLPSRHLYKVSKSVFENNRAYFVGIRELVFERDYYAADSDGQVYIETAGDETNIESNDLDAANGGWQAREVIINE